jgi:hypothetical protein
LNVGWSGMDDKSILTDSLFTQKGVTKFYDDSVLEAATPDIRRDLIQIHSEECDGAFRVWQEMNRHGWYDVKVADSQKLNELQNQISQDSPSLGIQAGNTPLGYGYQGGYGQTQGGYGQTQGGYGQTQGGYAGQYGTSLAGRPVPGQVNVGGYGAISAGGPGGVSSGRGYGVSASFGGAGGSLGGYGTGGQMGGFGPQSAGYNPGAGSYGQRGYGATAGFGQGGVYGTTTNVGQGGGYGTSTSFGQGGGYGMVGGSSGAGSYGMSGYTQSGASPGGAANPGYTGAIGSRLLGSPVSSNLSNPGVGGAQAGPSSGGYIGHGPGEERRF